MTAWKLELAERRIAELEAELAEHKRELARLERFYDAVEALTRDHWRDDEEVVIDPDDADVWPWPDDINELPEGVAERLRREAEK